MDLRKLGYFIAIVDEGSISAAAQLLHMTQPPLSQAVMTLEREIGAKLLERHARGVEPTAAGLLLVEQGKILLEWSERISQQVARVGKGESGFIYIAAMPAFAWSSLPSLLQDLRSAAPGIRVGLAEPGPAGVLRMVTEGTADIGFIANSDPSALAVAYPDLIVDTLSPLHLTLAVAADDDGGIGPIASLRELRRYEHRTWFIPEIVPAFQGASEITHDLWRAGGFHPDSIQTVQTLQSALPLIAAGMGVALVPRSLGGLHVTGIRHRSFGFTLPALYGVSIRSRQFQASESLPAFLEIIDAHFVRER